MKFDCYKDYSIEIMNDPEDPVSCAIKPLVTSLTGQYCGDDGTLNVNKFRQDFEDILSRMLQDLCCRKQVSLDTKCYKNNVDQMS